MNLSTFGTTSMLRKRLKKCVKKLKDDDQVIIISLIPNLFFVCLSKLLQSFKLILRDGIRTLSQQELADAIDARGMFDFLLYLIFKKIIIKINYKFKK